MLLDRLIQNNHEGNKTQLQFSGNDSTNERDDWVILHFVAVMYWPRVASI